jgi:hypothetical protein
MSHLIGFDSTGDATRWIRMKQVSICRHAEVRQSKATNGRRRRRLKNATLSIPSMARGARAVGLVSHQIAQLILVAAASSINIARENNQVSIILMEH